ncbi:MAG: CaiB/BaiF CoA-transferase family protein [Solirubrobacterales bacterium]
MSRSAPLAGVTVIDASWLLPGQFCGMVLSDLGARVIKIELPGGDYGRGFDAHGWAAVNRRKEGLTLNLRKPGGSEVMRRLAGRADVLLEGFRPGVMDRLGAGYETLREARPELVYCSVSGYGQEGEDRLRPGHGLNYAGVAGMLSIAGDSVRLAAILADLAGSTYAAISVLAALRHRDRHGVGQHLDVSITDATFSLLTDQLAGGHPDSAERPPSAGGFGVFTGGDGRRFTVGAVEDAFWAALCEVVDRPGWLKDPRYADDGSRRVHAAAIRAELLEIFAGDSAAAWLERLRAAGVPCGRFNELSEARVDPLAAERELFGSTAVAGVGSVAQVRFPTLFSGSALPPAGPAPAPGEHTEALLEELGYTAAERDRLRAAGTV